MPSYRRKPTVIEAEQLTRERVEAHLFDKAPLPRGVSLDFANYHSGRRELYTTQFSVVTIHGQHTIVAIGDWIIPEPDGVHFYPCKPDIFEATYEPV